MSHCNIDGGYGWVIVGASFILQGITGGFTLCFGILLSAFIEIYNESEASTAWIGSIHTSLIFGAGWFR